MRESYPTPEEFGARLLREPLGRVFDDYVLQGTPYVFRDCPERAQELKRHLAAELGTAPGNIFIVGSAKVGFSLSPDAFPRLFSDTSDIDVLVHDRRMFDRIWMSLVRLHYRGRSEGVYRPDRGWAAERRKNVYLGWFEPDRMNFRGLSLPKSMIPFRDVATLWFDAFQSLSVYPEFASRRVSGRLFRTLKHGRLYYVDGLHKIRMSLSRT